MATAVMAGVLGIHGPHSPEYVEAWESSLQAMWFETYGNATQRGARTEKRTEGSQLVEPDLRQAPGIGVLFELDYAPWMRLWRGHETEVLAEPRWIEHTIIPRERITQIAARYGVTADQIRMWNRGRLGKGLRKGRKLRILARQVPPAHILVTYEAQEGDSWGDIGEKFRVEPRVLKAWNWKARSLEPGDQIKVWFDPGAPWTVGRKLGPWIEPPPLPSGSISRGRPGRGRLDDAVQLPDSPLYTRRAPEVLYGSTHTLGGLTDAIAQFRHDTGYEGELVIGAISRRRGGRFKPHRSHQSGRDVDIRLPMLPGVPESIGGPNPDEIDWYATWGLMKALIDTERVQYIFLSGELQRRLYEAARVMGYSHDELRVLIQWPYDYGGVVPVVRHSTGHDTHFHVRFSCGPDEPKCKNGP